MAELVDYSRALEWQEDLVRLRSSGEIGDVLWLLEHPRTITFGTAGGAAHLLASADALAASGVGIHATRRGGDVTCHEPGQLVGYPIVSIAEDRDLHGHLRAIEEGLIGLLAGYGLAAGRVEGRTGVWLDAPARKVAAIGVRCSRWVTSHGFALNVTNDLGGFRLIVPCGIGDAAVTRLADELPPESMPPAARLYRDVHASMERAMGRRLELVVGADPLARLRRR